MGKQDWSAYVLSERKGNMKLRKYGYILVIISLMVFVFFWAVGKNGHEGLSEEVILQAGAGIMDELEIIRSRHMFLHNVWIYVDEEIPFVDEEIFDMIRAAYEEMKYSAEFEKGNLEVYEEYKQKFWCLLQNEVPFRDRETGKEIYIKDWTDAEGEAALSEIRECVYYFFDMNGDGLPELCIDNHVETVVFAYDPDTDQYILWARLGEKDIVGTRKAVWNPAHVDHICDFFQLDPYGNLELETLFWAEFFNGYGGRADINMVMFPNYADKEKRWEITEEMKQQGVLEESSRQWFFRITDEQFEELEKPYAEAIKLARERSKQEEYTYEELFGEYETE